MIHRGSKLVFFLNNSVIFVGPSYFFNNIIFVNAHSIILFVVDKIIT